MVLIMMIILGMMSVYTAESVLLERKMARMNWQHETLYNAAKIQLNDVEKRLPMECSIPIIEQQVSMNASIDWWVLHARCAGNFQLFQYYYLIEYSGSGALNAAHYRVSMLMLDKNSGQSVRLQSYVIQQGNAAPSRVFLNEF